MQGYLTSRRPTVRRLRLRSAFGAIPTPGANHESTGLPSALVTGRIPSAPAWRRQRAPDANPTTARRTHRRWVPPRDGTAPGGQVRGGRFLGTRRGGSPGALRELPALRRESVPGVGRPPTNHRAAEGPTT